MDKKVAIRSFETAEKLRGAVIRRYLTNQQAVIFISNKAAEQMPENNVFFEDGIWSNWPRVVAIKRDDEILRFKKSADGDEMFFYDLE